MKLNEPSAPLLEIPAVEAIAAFLREAAFRRKIFGGCDYNEVLECFAEVTRGYNNIIESLLPMRGQALQAYELQDSLGQAKQEYESLRHYCAELRQCCERQRQEILALQAELMQRGWSGFMPGQ
ncbi:MAG: hypothetical protein FWH26_10835 [Oscillospiraceae bacterium]|nr:hypothetical protein [Oscillospiraceae bacterium]